MNPFAWIVRGPGGKGGNGLPLSLFVPALVIGLLPVLVTTQFRERAALEQDVASRATLLARAAWVRIVEARQEIPGVLTVRPEGRDTRIEFTRLPWYSGPVRLLGADRLEDVPAGTAVELLSGQFDAGRTERLVAGNWRFIAARMVPDAGPDVRVLPGLDCAGSPGQMVPQAMTRPSARPVPQRTADGGVAETRLFFERQRRFDRLAFRLDALGRAGNREQGHCRILLVSDRQVVAFSGSDERQPALTPARLAVLDAWGGEILSGFTGLSAGRGLAVCGFRSADGLAIVDLAIPVGLPLIERVLDPLPLLLAGLGLFIVFRTTGYGGRRFSLVLLVVLLGTGTVLLAAASADRLDARSRTAAEFVSALEQAHVGGNEVIAQAAPKIWRDFVFSSADQNTLAPGRAAWPVALLSGFAGLLAVLFLVVQDWRPGRRWRSVPGGIFIGVAILLFLLVLLDAFPVVAGRPAVAGAADFLALLGGATLVVLAQLFVAFGLIFVFPWLSRRVRRGFLALAFLPLLLPFAFAGLLRESAVSGGLSAGLLFFCVTGLAGLPVIVFAMLLARQQISFSCRQALALHSEGRLRRYVALDLPVCLAGATPAVTVSFMIALFSAGGAAGSGYPAALPLLAGASGHGFWPLALFAILLCQIFFFMRTSFYALPLRTAS